MTNKIKLKAPTSGYNPDYKGKISLSDVIMEEEEIIRIHQKKRDFLKIMLEQKELPLTFTGFNKVVVVGAYVDFRQEADHYGTKEELIVFQLFTDTSSFLAGLHFMGNTSMEHCHYFLHVPKLDETHYDLVFDAVLDLTDFWDHRTVTINQA